MAASETARWQWSVWDDEGWLAGCALIPDGDRRAWFCGYPGKRMQAHHLRPMIRVWRDFVTCNLYDVARAWIRSEDPVAIGFAEAFGFRYDCGPARGLSPTGADMTLYAWRR